MANITDPELAGEFRLDIGAQLLRQELCDLDDRQRGADTNIDGLTRRLLALKGEHRCPGHIADVHEVPQLLTVLEYQRRPAIEEPSREYGGHAGIGVG